MIKNIKNTKDIKNLATTENKEIIKENKELYGEVITPFCLIDKMFDIIPQNTFENPDFKWLDPGAGTGNFSIALYFRLFEHLKAKIPDIEERKEHIIQNMMFMVEIRPENVEKLKNLFGPNANIFEGNYLNYLYNRNINSITPQIFDVIIGNPPFNCNGLKKVPTNSNIKKSGDGSTIWSGFIIKSLGLLKQKTGILCMFIPSIWLKPDKERMYYYLTTYDIKKLNCFTNTQTNKIFKGNAQTPSCFFLLTKRKTDNIISILDKDRNEYIDYTVKYSIPIPVFGVSIVNKLQKYCGNNRIKVIKTNLPPKNTILSMIQSEETPYPNITTCLLNRKAHIPEMIFNYSNKPLYAVNQQKLVLAHKMYGLPYLDKEGTFGISNRDNYVIFKEKLEDLIKLHKFLSTKTALYIFESTRYRMKYLEKYAFELIPDITNMPDFPEEINDDTIADYFQFDEINRKNIKML